MGGGAGGCAPRMRSTHHCETKPIKSSAESPTSSVTGPGKHTHTHRKSSTLGWTEHRRQKHSTSFVYTRLQRQNKSAKCGSGSLTAVGQVQRLREQRDGEHDEYVEDRRAEAAGDGHLGAGGAARHALRVVRLLLVPPPRQHVRRKAIRHLHQHTVVQIGQTTKHRGHDRQNQTDSS